MDLKTQAVDRVLEALSPALAAELDRVVQETREALEQEFQNRLQAAVREAEATAASAAEVQREGAVAEAKEETQKRVTAELEQQFRERLDAAATQLKDEASAERAKFEAAATQLNKEASAERANLQDQLDQWRIFAETQRQLAEASSQPEILSRFLSLAQPFADGLAVYVTKAGGFALWKSKGKGVFPKIISQETADPESYFRIIAVRGKTVGAICAAPPFKAEALDFLAGSLERAIEVFGLKLRAPVSKPAASETTA